MSIKSTFYLAIISTLILIILIDRISNKKSIDAESEDLEFSAHVNLVQQLVLLGQFEKKEIYKKHIYLFKAINILFARANELSKTLAGQMFMRNYCISNYKTMEDLYKSKEYVDFLKQIVAQECRFKKKNFYNYRMGGNRNWPDMDPNFRESEQHEHWEYYLNIIDFNSEDFKTFGLRSSIWHDWDEGVWVFVPHILSRQITGQWRSEYAYRKNKVDVRIEKVRACPNSPHLYQDYVAATRAMVANKYWHGREYSHIMNILEEMFTHVFETYPEEEWVEYFDILYTEFDCNGDKTGGETLYEEHIDACLEMMIDDSVHMSEEEEDSLCFKPVVRDVELDMELAIKQTLYEHYRWTDSYNELNQDRCAYIDDHEFFIDYMITAVKNIWKHYLPEIPITDPSHLLDMLDHIVHLLELATEVPFGLTYYNVIEEIVFEDLDDIMIEYIELFKSEYLCESTNNVDPSIVDELVKNEISASVFWNKGWIIETDEDVENFILFINDSFDNLLKITKLTKTKWWQERWSFLNPSFRNKNLDNLFIRDHLRGDNWKFIY
jgi:hypothetical protein